GSVIEDEAAHFAVLGDDALYAKLHLALAARFLVATGEGLEDGAHAVKGAGKAFEEQRGKEDCELGEIQIVLFCAAVEGQRQKEHVGEQWVGDIIGHDLAGGDFHAVERGVGAVLYVGDEPAEAVDLLREGARYLGLEQRKIVIE